MTKIYTKTGDAGETGLWGGVRVKKSALSVEVLGELDELMASLGLARSLGLPAPVDVRVARLLEQLFSVGAAIAQGGRGPAKRIDLEWAQEWERAIDEFDRELPALDRFILPGGDPGASALHLARAVCRRAERSVTKLVEVGGAEPAVVVTLNRLSDLLFVLARTVNHQKGAKEVVWNGPA